MSKFRLCAFADEAADSLSEQIRALRENGVDLIELRNVDGKGVLSLDKPQITEVKKMLDESGISVWSLGSPIGKININDDFSEHFEQFKKALEYCGILGTKNMRIFSFFINDGAYDDCKNKVIEQLSMMLEEAEKYGVTLCHENEKGIYGDIADRCVQLHKALPKLRAVFDPANFVQCSQETLSAFEMLSPYIEYMHIKDSKSDMTVVPAGMGDGNIPQLLNMYKGEVLTLEPHLWQFSGLKNLEREDEQSVVTNGYGSQREAFDTALKAVKNLI